MTTGSWRARAGFALGAAVFLLAMLAAPARAQSPPAHLPGGNDLQQSAGAAQAEGQPLLLMFSLPDCAYCKVVRRNYLLPLLRGASTDRVQIRELNLSGRQAIRDFDGTVTTPAAVARRYQVRVAPTLVFVDGHGQMLVEPLVGGDHAFYDAYLERAVEASRRALASRAR